MNHPADVVSQLTLEEKAALCTGATTWTTTAVAHALLPEIMMTDGPHGVRKTLEVTGLSSPSVPATCFPTASASACSWNPALIGAMGQAIGEEAVALGVNIVLGPGVNIKRTPLCGRNFEYFSEDPFLAGTLAVAFINGVQGEGVGTSLKHFAANNQESERFLVNAQVDDRTLREIYLPAFEMAVKQAQPWTVMCAYNRLNGVYCSENEWLLTTLLKHEWGFQGFVVSDWGAVHDRVASLAGGLDLEMPGPRPRRTRALVDAVQNGALDVAVLDEATRRIVRVAALAQQTTMGGAFDVEGHHALARRIAGESMVLLKNDGTLPLKASQRIAVIGRAAQNAHFQGGGSSHINPTRVDSPLEMLRAAAPHAAIHWCAGYPEGEATERALIEEAVIAAQAADVALVYVALPGFKESEGYDRPDLDLTDHQVELIKAVSAVQSRTVVIVNSGSAVAMSAWIDSVAAVLQAWMMGQAGGGAIADILFGVVNPSGKLAETFPLRIEDTPAYVNFPGDLGTVRYGEGLFVGYRWYDARNLPTLFPFGYGLSYTTFTYSNIQVSAARVRDVDGVSVSVDVTNSGPVRGMETVQVYVHDVQSTLVRPVRELKGFAKVELEPGETKRVTVALDARAFAFWHVLHQQWVVESGDFDLLVGASSADMRVQARVRVESTQVLPSLLNRESTVRSWLEDAHGKQVFAPQFAAIAQLMAATFGAPEEGSGNIGMDMTGFIMEMPLISLLQFNEESLPGTAEQMVDEMLAQMHALE